MYTQKILKWSWKFLYTVLIGVAVLLGLRIIWFKPYEIPSPSMLPTLLPGDCIIVNKLAYLWHGPLRGDIVVFEYPADPERVFIKRVVAIEGENFKIDDSQVFINGIPLDEPYINKENYASFSAQRVPPGHLLVLGDNRNKSRDSRDWGMLPKSNLLGKALCIYSPVQRLRILR